MRTADFYEYREMHDDGGDSLHAVEFSHVYDEGETAADVAEFGRQVIVSHRWLERHGINRATLTDDDARAIFAATDAESVRLTPFVDESYTVLRLGL